MYVIDNENQKSKFERPRIKRKIIEETNVSEEIAEKISLSVAKTIKDNYKEEISTNTIRSLINAQLIKRGLLEEEEKSRKLGMSVSDYEKLLSEGCKDNANIGFSPEMVSKYAYDSIAKEYALLTMPEDCANAHIEGYFHCLSENNNIIVKDSKDNILKVNIKKFVEKMFGKEEYYVPSINTNHLKKSWKKVKYATKTGYKKCYEITFSNGYKVEVTKDHKLIKYDNKKIIPKNYDITLKDYINTGDNFIINLNYKTKEYEKLKILSYKYIGKKEVYNLTVEINHNFLAGTEGYILVQNCHDLEYYNTRPNCISGNNNIIIKDENDNISYTTIKHFVEEMFLTDENYYVPSLNIKTNIMEWKKIENAYLSSPLEETYLVTFGKGYSIECTSDHKFIKSHNNKPQKQYDIKVSEFDNYKDLRLCNITDLKENNNLNNYNESALFGFFLGDGYISHKGNIRFNFSKKDKAEYLYHLLEQLNIKFTYSEKESNYYDSGYLYSFYIKDKIYPQLSKSELIKKYTSKYNLTGILEGLINSDGHIRLDINNVLRLNFTNTNKNIFDLYQLCLISNGIRGSINITEFDNPNHKDAYNSSSFGKKLLSLLSSMNICNRFIPIIKEANPNMKKYNENSELTVRSIEYTGTQAVYNLTIADNHNYLAGINGFVLIQNCMNYTSEFFAKNGLKIDGIGLMGSVAKPAKSLEVLLNHMLQALMAGATVFSGGQGFANFNTFLAPFCKGRTYSEIKQAIQGFIFNCNMSLICRGGQVLFSSIGLDLSIPEILKNRPAVAPEGVINGVYGDYQNEADMVFKAVCEVSNEKDGNGAYHRFPNILFNIRRGDLDEYEGNCKLLHELGANNPTIYYVNCMDLERTVMGCVDGDEGIWCKIDNEVSYKTFYELSEMLNANYGATAVDNIKVLTIDDNKNIIWDKVKYFIKNKNQQMYKVTLSDGKSFICDDNHELLTVKGINPINIFDCTKGSNILGLNYRGNNIDFNIDYMAVLYGFYLGDGDKTNNHGIIAVSKEDKKIYLEELFDKLDVDYSYKFSERSQDERHSNPNIHKFYFSKDIINNYKPDLTDNNVLAGILSGMLSSDGYVRFTGSYNNSLCAEFVSTNFEYIKLFEYCCFMLGLKFKTSLKSKQKENHSDFKRVYISCNNNTVYVLKQLFLRNKQANLIKSISSDGYRNMNNYKSIRIKSIEKVGFGDSFCIEVNGRMIFGEEFILSAQCRTALPMNYFENYELDCLNTGNFMYNTINLPLIAIESENESVFYRKLDEIVELIYKSLHHRRKEVINAVYIKKMSNFLIQKDKDTGEPLWDIDRTTITIGYCGLNECLEILYDKNIIEAENEGLKIINFLNKKKEAFNKRDGLRWSVIGSPAESTAHRFAKIIKEKYPDVHVQGEEGNYYLTNSSHIPVSSEMNLAYHIKNASKFHKISQGGNILHLWLGEVWSDPVAIWKLNKKIIETGTLFWAYSKVFTFCNECGETINDKIEKCQKCGSTDLTTYDRITGYYLPTNGYNNGKKQEFEDRFRHKINI